MSKRDTLLLLEGMLGSSIKIKNYTEKVDFDSFISDDKTVDAAIRNFEIIGEAANRIDLEFRELIQRLNGIEFVDSEIE
jgi:uncharacterized protein with HEPN domain